MVSIFSGDDTDAFGANAVTVKYSGGVALDGCRAVFEMLGIRREFAGLSGNSATLRIAFSAAETQSMPCGTHCATLRLYDPFGRVRTVADGIRIRVTACAAEAYSADSDGQTIEVTDGAAAITKDELAALFDGLDLADTATQREVRAMLQEIIAKLKGLKTAAT